VHWIDSVVARKACIIFSTPLCAQVDSDCYTFLDYMDMRYFVITLVIVARHMSTMAAYVLRSHYMVYVMAHMQTLSSIGILR